MPVAKSGAYLWFLAAVALVVAGALAHQWALYGVSFVFLCNAVAWNRIATPRGRDLGPPNAQRGDGSESIRSGCMKMGTARTVSLIATLGAMCFVLSSLSVRWAPASGAWYVGGSFTGLGIGLLAVAVRQYVKGRQRQQ